MKKLIPALAFSMLCFFATAQSWTQLSSSDLEGAFTDAVHHHNGSWFLSTGGGVWKSTNGTSWTNSSNNLFTALGRLRVEGFTSSGSNLIGINRWNGIVLSGNDGASWSKSTTGLPTNYRFNEFITTANGLVFAACEDGDVNEWNIYTSNDNGLSWTKGALLPNEASLFASGDTVIINYGDSIGGWTTDGTSINVSAFASQLPNEGEVERVARVGNYLMVTGDGTFYRWNLIGGTAWEEINNNIGTAFFAAVYGSGDVAYAAALGFTGSKFYRSSDFGDTWTDLTPTVSKGIPFAISCATSGDAFIANFIDAGMFYSSNQGTTIVDANDNLKAYEFEEFFANGNTIMGGTFTSGVYRSADMGNTFAESNSGMPVEALRYIYGFQTDGTNIFANFSTSPGGTPSPDRLLKSTDDGASWSVVSNPSGESNIQLLGMHGTKLVGRSEDSEMKYFLSNDAGSTWTEFTTGLPSNVSPVAMGGDGSTLYMVAANSTNHPEIYKSTNDGTSWALDMTGIDNSTPGEIDSQDLFEGLLTKEGQVFYAYEDENYNETIYRKQGANWVEIDHIGLNWIDVEAWDYNNGVLYLSMWREGVYMSSDLGDNFTDISTGLTEGLDAQAFAFQGSKVLISTNGAGIWSYDVVASTKDTQLSSTHSIYPNPTTGLISLPAQTVSLSIFTISGRLIETFLTANQNSLDVSRVEPGTYLVGINTNEGTVYERITIQ